MEPDTGTDRLMTPGEVARVFRVDPKTIWSWARAGKLRRIVTPGGTGRYYEADIRAIVDGPQQGGNR